MNKLMRLVKGGSSFVRIVRDPNRLGEVFDMADQIADRADLQDVVDGLTRTPEVARALQERPRLDKIDLSALRTLSEGTLGRVFAEHMIANNLDPGALPSRTANDPTSYVLAHSYETHDIWHVVTGFSTDVIGEGGLQAFYAAQVPGRISLSIMAAILLNTTLTPAGYAERDARLQAIARGWLLGRRARPLFGVRWNELWEMPLTAIQSKFDVDVTGVDELLHKWTVRRHAD